MRKTVYICETCNNTQPNDNEMVTVKDQVVIKVKSNFKAKLNDENEFELEMTIRSKKDVEHICLGCLGKILGIPLSPKMVEILADRASKPKA